MDPPSAAELKAKWEIAPWQLAREASQTAGNLSLRVRRALSWLERAEQAHRDADHDTAFILYWIAFNAAYGQAGSAAYGDQPERDNQRACCRRIAQLDQSLREALVSQAIQDPIYALLNSKYVYEPFWKHHNGMPGYQDWETRFERRRYRTASAMRQMRATDIAAEQNIESVLCELFDRLYTLRNQLLHGGATWNSSVNRDQVTQGAAVMAALMPRFIDVMIENPDAEWGPPRYPVVND